jgi:V8-like Glu-specific endopeptidase
MFRKTRTAYILGISGMIASSFAQADPVVGGPVDEAQSNASGGIDYQNAKAMRLPKADSGVVEGLLLNPPPFAAAEGEAGGDSGSPGNGKQHPLLLSAPIKPKAGGVTPQEFGTSNHVFTTSEVNAYGNQTSLYYPFRAAGKLFFKIGTGSYVCSASLVKPGVIVTAAHCVANFGKKQIYASWQFAPAYNNGSAPYGLWDAQAQWVMTSYFNGTDSCAQAGVVCKNDVAVIVLKPKVNAAGASYYPGSNTGWFGYYYGGSGFNSSGQALISQLGYPVALDAGSLMERTESQGYVNSSLSNNTIIGSLQTGGSSGGPWLVNLGKAPVLSGTSFGSWAGHNAVVGVTSWGYTNTAVKEQGASSFTSGNIVPLLNTACTAIPGAC